MMCIYESVLVFGEEKIVLEYYYPLFDKGGG